MNFIIYPPKTAIAGHILGYPIRYYGLIMAFCFLVGVFLAYFLFYKRVDKNEAEKFFDYSPFVIALSLVGARLFYVIASYDYYISYPKEIIMLNHGGLSIFGAIIFGIISLFILSKKYCFDFLKHCDVLAVVFPLCQAIGRFGNYFNQEAFGYPADTFLKLYVEKQYRPDIFLDVKFFHPTFLYESILDLVIFVVLIVLFFNNKKLKTGSIFLLYLILYSFVRFFIEGLRIDSVLNIFNFHVAQLISIIIFAITLFLIVFINKKASN